MITYKCSLNGVNLKVPRKKLPIGIQTFEEIRKNEYIYIDKTKEAYELINSYKYVFLSRPRRLEKAFF